MAETIPPQDLVPMDVFCAAEPLKIDLVYADADHPENIFSCAPYHPKARLILHRELARVVIKAARTLHKENGWILVLKDGLRTVEAQRILMDTDVVRRNPHWLQEPRLLSGPGQGAHPRGMAIDVSALDENGKPVDMGTVFDAMVPESARDHAGFPANILDNRATLEKAFARSAEDLSLPMLPLPSEWWDFRFPRDYTGRFAPLSDSDLPACLRMTSPGDETAEHDFGGLAKSVLMSL